MLWWISGGIVLLALIVLIVVALSVMSRLRAFDNAARAMQARLEDGQRRVEPRLATLQQTVEQMMPQLEAMAAQQAAKQRVIENS
ncbi:hypothetical protein ACQP2P_16950 [Dactylosporangium sp. CA-139114]|uniref:hypothetical protein n=1 Tax=Dactylosporangium sp. CA-139114 TaxID=3239931 RepID=UPI003D955412